MIPNFVSVGGVWRVLPPGIHNATIKEIENGFATNKHRENLFDGFVRGTKALLKAGCKGIFLDGSFISEKPIPGDFDVCWDPVGVDDRKLDPVLLDFSHGRRNQKRKFGGEFFPSSAMADGKSVFLDYFQEDKHSGKKKGIIHVLFP